MPYYRCTTTTYEIPIAQLNEWRAAGSARPLEVNVVEQSWNPGFFDRDNALTRNSTREQSVAWHDLPDDVRAVLGRTHARQVIILTEEPRDPMQCELGLSNEQAIERVRRWQERGVHPLTCGVKSSHPVLEPVENADNFGGILHKRVVLTCTACGYVQRHIPSVVLQELP